MTTDKRNRLEESAFAYRLGKDSRVFICWHGKEVTTLKGRAAEKFLRKVKGVGSREAQLAMAKATGNFKHGNER